MGITVDVDIGNTYAKWRMQGAEHVYSQPSETLRDGWHCSEVPVSRVRVASVAQADVTAAFCQNVKERFGIAPDVVKVMPCWAGVKPCYRDISRLGVDRWLALIGVRQLDPKDCLVIDAGTAVTIDAMDREGQHRGGWILPGSQLMSKALTTGTPLALSQECGLLNFAKETSQGIANGVLAGIIGAIQQAILEATHVFGQSPQIWLTGGAASMLSPWIAYPHQVHADLVFLGLQQYGRLTCNR